MKRLYTGLFLCIAMLCSLASGQSISINPNQWNKAKTISINISGNDTRFKNGKGVNMVSFTQGSNTITPDTFVVNSDTNITATIFVHSSFSTGYYTAYVHDDYDGALTQSNAVNVVKKVSPYLIQIYPDSIRRGQTLPIGVVGLYTNFDRVANTVWLQQGTTVVYATQQYVYSSELVIADFSMPSSAPTGFYDMFVKNTEDSILAYPSAVYVTSGPLAQITSITPDTARRGQTVHIKIKGRNSHLGVGFVDTYAALIYGNDKDSITGSIYALNSPTDADMSFDIPLNADTGSYVVKVYSPYDGVLTAQQRLKIKQSLITKLTGISPSVIGSGQKTTITISAKKTSFKSITTKIWINQGSVDIVPFSYSIIATDVIKAAFVIPRGAGLGFYNVNVFDSTDGTLTLENGLRIIRPRIKSVSPAKASAGRSITATVSTFGTHYLKDSISDVWLLRGGDKIPGYNSSVSNDSTFNVKFSIPVTFSGYYKLFVISGRGDTLQLDSAIRIDLVPEIKIVSPDSSLVNNILTVSISGKNLKLKTGTTTVWLNKDSNTVYGSNITIGTDDSLSFKLTVPSGTATGYYDVNISNTAYGSVSKQHAFYITSSFAAARITGSSPDSVRRTQTVNITVTGQNTNFLATASLWLSQGSSTLYPDKLTANNNTSLSADFSIPITAKLGWYTVNVSDYKDGNLDYSNALYVEDKPAGALTSITPDSVYQGDSVTVDIYGSHTILDNTKAYDIFLRQGGSATLVAYHVKIISSEHIQASFYARYTDATGWYDLSIANSYDYLTLSDAFRVLKTLHPPVIVSFNPHSAVQGDTVMLGITGDRTNFSQYATVYLLSKDSVMLTGIIKSAASVSDMRVRFDIPDNAVTGDWNLFVDDKSSGLLIADSFFTILPKTGLAENQQKGLKLKIYPDPFLDNLKIGYYLRKATQVTIQMTDVSGKAIFNKTMPAQLAGNNEYSADLSGLCLKEGIYFIKISTSEDSNIIKVLKTE